VYTFKDERDCNRWLLSSKQTSFSFFALYSEPCKEHSLLSESSNTFFFLGVNSTVLSKSRFYSTKCLTLRFGEERRRLILPSSPPQAFSSAQHSSVLENV
jgi:hypothetical protein